MASLRIVGVSPAPDVSDWREPLPEGKWSQFFGALAARVEVIDVVSPQLSKRESYLNLLRWAAPDRERWLARAGFNQSFVARVNRALERELSARAGGFDLIMQMQTLCAPGFDRRGVPYAIYTDNTMALTQRLYPPGARLSAAGARRWMDLEADVCNAASAVFTLSEFARESVIDDYGCAPERVVAVGAGTNQYLAELPERVTDIPRALFVGEDFTRKGGRVLLDAWQRVIEEIPEAELVIAGPRRNPVPAETRRVRWVGRVNRDTLASLYESASVFVLPSLFEPWGFVFFEAMGHGLPCVGTSHCAMPEIIDADATGLLAAPADPQSLADAILTLLADPGRARAMGRAGHAKALEHYTWGRVAERVLDHLGALPTAGA